MATEYDKSTIWEEHNRLFLLLTDLLQLFDSGRNERIVERFAHFSESDIQHIVHLLLNTHLNFNNCA